MSVPRYHIDTNVLLRFLEGTPSGMFAGASALIEKADRGEVLLELSPLVLAETAFTMESFFKIPRKEVAALLLRLVERPGFRLADKDLFLDALARVQSTGVHLVDAHLAASASESGFPVASFDRDFDKFKDVVRFEPKP